MGLTAGGVAVYHDSAGHLFENPSDAQIASLSLQIASKADLAAIPQPATTTPRSEMTGGYTGAVSARYAREDHQHPRQTSTTYATLASNGQATVSFSRTFVNKPGLNLSETDAVIGSQPLVLRGLGWVQDANGLYTGVVVQGSRAQLLPALAPLSTLLTLLSGVVSGVNTALTMLTNYNIFGGSAAGATVSVIAVARSDVPAT
jgi:hypothetical protein